MIKARLPAYPLITIDPLFSIWSMSDKLYESETRMWTGAEKPLRGNIVIDGKVKRFMGAEGAKEVIEQTNLELSMTSTRYTFEDEKIRLKVKFTSPFILDKKALCACPLSYIDISVESRDGWEHEVEVAIEFDERLTYANTKKLTRAGVLPFPEGRIAWLGRLLQRSLTTAGDKKEIDWGWLYLAGQSDISVSGIPARFKYNDEKGAKPKYRKSLVSKKTGTVKPGEALKYFIALAYDDIYSVNYFGEYKKGYWKTEFYNIVNALQEGIKNHDKNMAIAKAFDKEAESEAINKDYLILKIAAYRQVMAAHKMVGEGEDILFLSKECSSNGCMATADVSYPSAPLFLLKAPELVKGMLIPIFNFARMRVWRFDFAPHDAGVYPYCTGQVYGANGVFVVKSSYIPIRKHVFRRTKAKRVYDIKSQMPVEECGNMLILSAAYFNETGDTAFIKENADMLSKWAEYLVGAGIRLPLQLCTDDFQGHSEHNVNLAIKGITGIAAWGLLLNKLQEGEGNKYLETARSYAKELERIADVGDRTALTIDDRKSWSIKYNLVWDKLFKTNLFSEELFKKEVAFYKKKLNKYGVPLDSRTTSTKSDWLIWAAALDDGDEALKDFSKALVQMLRDTKHRAPFTDRYDTVTADLLEFYHRSVQGGLWMAEYKKHILEKKGYLF